MLCMVVFEWLFVVVVVVFVFFLSTLCIIRYVLVFGAVTENPIFSLLS